MSKNIFTDSDKEAIKKAVAQLENASSGELVLYYAKDSDSYVASAWKFSGLIGVIYSLGIITLSYQWLLPPNFTPIIISTTILLAMVVTFIIAWFVPKVRISVTPATVIEHRVLTKARDIFLQEQVFNTLDRTGILIYISALERKVMVIGDKGINEKINQSDWENVVQLVINGIKSKQMTKGIIEAIEVCQKLLLDNGFNVRRDDVNELHDAIRIEE